MPRFAYELQDLIGTNTNIYCCTLLCVQMPFRIIHTLCSRIKNKQISRATKTNWGPRYRINTQFNVFVVIFISFIKTLLVFKQNHFLAVSKARSLVMLYVCVNRSYNKLTLAFTWFYVTRWLGRYYLLCGVVR